MTKYLNLSWIETLKYRADGSTYYDYIIPTASEISITSGFYEPYTLSKDDNSLLSNNKLLIAFNEYNETQKFVKKSI